jgi:hypothetical protein
MKLKHRFDTTETGQVEAAKIRKMIADLSRTVLILNSDIAAEEERVGISDRSEATYPILARMLAARCYNLRNTIAALEQRLSNLPGMPAELACHPA